jgi:GR25 family glycosyltransferase involved in LPS biosynthesis
MAIVQPHVKFHHYHDQTSQFSIPIVLLFLINVFQFNKDFASIFPSSSNLNNFGLNANKNNTDRKALQHTPRNAFETFGTNVIARTKKVPITFAPQSKSPKKKREKKKKKKKKKKKTKKQKNKQG